MTEFWNSETTEASWKGLQELSKEVDFVLIGGWAVYLYSKLQKSKDIDIIVDYETLRILESGNQMKKNERLKKYEIQKDKYDIDIYLPKYSALAIPPKDIMEKYSRKMEGFTVATPEALLALKLAAASDRRESSKGQKDEIDILGLLFYSGLNFVDLKGILSEYGLLNYIPLLTSILSKFDLNNLSYLNLNESSFAKLKRKYVEEIKKMG